MLLRRALVASACALAASGLLFLALVLVGRQMPASLAWGFAYGVSIMATLGVAGFAWVVLSLPPGAPLRTLGLRVAAGVGLLAGALLFARG